jgi:serine protease inhibitor
MTQAGSAVATLTARWLAALPGERDTAVSGAGLWPLLALLAGASDGRARDELTAAVGMGGDEAATAARDLLDTLDASPDIAAATGTWLREGVPLHDWWREHVRTDSIGRLTSQAALDAWASERTDGLIDHLPVRLGPDTLLVLATALLLRTSWRQRFDERERGGHTWLARTSSGVADIAVHADTATVLRVRGEQDVDVLLGIGDPGAARADVIAALLTGQVSASGADLLAGRPAPGVRLGTAAGGGPRTVLRLPAFEVRCQHDLLAQAEVLGLRAAADIGGFPRLSPVALRVAQARQQVLARFFATGFEAAAVTATAMVASARVRAEPVPVLHVTLDRPFAFAAVHRPTGVPVVAGWIADVPPW